jgi:uncharacterized protein
MPDLLVSHIETSLADGTRYRVPYWDVRSGRPGPCVLVTAALHGNELQGGEVLRRLLPELRGQLAAGSCLLFPFLNRQAVARRQPHIDFEPGRYYGSDAENNLNCSWPGRADGTSAQRLAETLYREILPRATHLLDLHSWQHGLATTALARSGHEGSLALARATALRFLRHAAWKPEIRLRPVFPCSQTSIFNDTGRAAICIEFAGQYGFWEREIRLGVRAVRNCFRRLGLLPGDPEGLEEEQVWLNDAARTELPAPASGVFIPAGLCPGDPVEKGQRLGRLLHDESLREEDIAAPAAGYVHQFGAIRGVGRNDTARDPMITYHPYVTAGEVLAIVVSAGRA